MAYHMDRTQMGDYDAYVIAWRNGRCVQVFVASDRDQQVLLQAVDRIAVNLLQSARP